MDICVSSKIGLGFTWSDFDLALNKWEMVWPHGLYGGQLLHGDFSTSCVSWRYSPGLQRAVPRNAQPRPQAQHPAVLWNGIFIVHKVEAKYEESLLPRKTHTQHTHTHTHTHTTHTHTHMYEERREEKSTQSVLSKPCFQLCSSIYI